MSSSSSSSDPVAPLADWWRRGRSDTSFSSVRVRADTGTHVFRVGSFSRLDGTMSPGECIESVAHAGGSPWRLFYYPNGATAEQRGKVCVELMLLDARFWLFRESTWNLTAGYTVSVLGRDGEPAHSCAFAASRYKAEKKTGEAHVLATAEEQSAAAAQHDDSLLVRCDVTVRKISSQNLVMCFLRNRFLV
ncbi:hypothetical protein BS78_09G019500 [Paspalum vaginatum]|nr:hypothetical protein BS78_09G019500 [Paspalum vaginatum]